MAEGKRPGGLTALAVLNFVFGGLGALGLLALFALLGGAKVVADAAGAKTHDPPGASAVYLALLFSAVGVALLIASGIGYIQQKRVLGRGVGNVYAIVSMVGQVISLVMLHNGFGIANIIGWIYPILTLILLNTTFKDDLVN